jgi:glycosyltransferase involved in cell wall biosynthesis
MKKKILYIHHGKGLGGAPLSLLYLIQNLDKEKFEPIVLFLHYSEAVELYKSKNINLAGIVDLQDFPHSKIRWYRWYHPHLFFRSILDSFKTRFFIAKKWIKKINPDLIHLNTSSLTVWAQVAKKMKIPVVSHVREPLANGYFGVRKNIITKRVQKYSDVITPICNNDANPWRSCSKVQVINNSVDHHKFDKNLSPKSFCEKYNLNKNDPKVLFLGGLSKEKGTLEVLKIFKQLLKLLPNSKLILAGCFDLSINSILSFKRYFPNQRYNLKIKKILKSISSSIVFTGPIKEVEAALKASDVLLVPFTQGHFARPIIEAGFMAKPVIASKLAPLDELMIHGQTGYLLDLKNKGLWVEKLYALMTNKKLNEQIGNKAYEFCTKNFNVNDHAKKFEVIYEALTESNTDILREIRSKQNLSKTSSEEFSAKTDNNLLG